jgi:hypothetical protein
MWPTALVPENRNESLYFQQKFTAVLGEVFESDILVRIEFWRLSRVSEVNVIEVAYREPIQGNERVLQSVQIFKIGKWVEISVLGSPDSKEVKSAFQPMVCTYVRTLCTTGLNGKK